MTVAYDIERVLAASERLCAAIASALKHDSLPDWIRHRLNHLAAEAEAVERAINNHYKNQGETK